MKIEVIEALVRVNEDTTIPRTGVNAILATEIELLRDLHEDGDRAVPESCCIREARVIGVVDVLKEHEMARLLGKYKADVVNTIYPRGRGLCLTLAEADLPALALAPKPKAPPVQKGSTDDAVEKAGLRELLKAHDIDIPRTVQSVEALQALVAEHNLTMPEGV